MQEVIEHLDATLRALKNSPDLSIDEALPIQDRLGKIILTLWEKSPELDSRSDGASPGT